MASASLAAAQDSLAVARKLYSAAAYDDALTMLNRLSRGEHSVEDKRLIGLYRTLSLMALGRTTEAVRGVEAIVTEDPSYRPSASDIPPRLRSLFGDTRRRLLPAIVQEQYLAAKAAWDRKDFAAAARGFAAVLEQLDDPDLASATSQPKLADLRILATGFKELSVRSAPAAASPAPPPRTTSAPTDRPSNGIFSVEDTNVAMPIILKQSIPVPRKTAVPTQGAVEVVIDETGSVVSAVMKVSTNGPYDQIVLAATKEWRYQPATLQGVPVKFRKLVTIAVPASR
jgi:hypothetical protein